MRERPRIFEILEQFTMNSDNFQLKCYLSLELNNSILDIKNLLLNRQYKSDILPVLSQYTVKPPIKEHFEDC